MSDYYLYNMTFPHLSHGLSSHFVFLCSLTIIYHITYINSTFLNSLMFYIFVSIMDWVFFSLYFATDLLGFVYLFYILCLPSSKFFLSSQYFSCHKFYLPKTQSNVYKAETLRNTRIFWEKENKKQNYESVSFRYIGKFSFRV